MLPQSPAGGDFGHSRVVQASSPAAAQASSGKNVPDIRLQNPARMGRQHHEFGAVAFDPRTAQRIAHDDEGVAAKNQEKAPRQRSFGAAPCLQQPEPPRALQQRLISAGQRAPASAKPMQRENNEFNASGDITKLFFRYTTEPPPAWQKLDARRHIILKERVNGGGGNRGLCNRPPAGNRAEIRWRMAYSDVIFSAGPAGPPSRCFVHDIVFRRHRHIARGSRAAFPAAT